MEKYFDMCDRCSSRELDFILFDLKHDEKDLWLKDIAGFRCRECGEVLVSSGVIDTVDEVITKINRSMMFPMLRYQQRVLKSSGLDRDLNERYLHSWDLVRHDGRKIWQVVGFRTFGALKELTAI